MFFKGNIYYKLEAMTHSLGPKVREMGQNFAKQGLEMQGKLGHTDKLVPSLRGIPISNSKYPKVLKSDWVAPNAVLIGDIKMGSGSSAWHGATLRGDINKIRIGKNSMVQDNSHISGGAIIGDNVFVGPNAQVHDCKLESFSYVGMGATVDSGATV